MQYRSLCCDSESMFNLVVYSSTHSLVGGTGDAIIQGRATVPRAFLFHCSSSTIFSLRNRNFVNFMLLSPKRTHSALLLLMQRRGFLKRRRSQAISLSTCSLNLARNRRCLARFSNNFARNPSATACLGIRPWALSYFGQSIFC